jgi:hypothetical protein
LERKDYVNELRPAKHSNRKIARWSASPWNANGFATPDSSDKKLTGGPPQYSLKKLARAPFFNRHPRFMLGSDSLSLALDV